MESYTKGKHAKAVTVVINVRIVGCIFWRALGKPMGVAKDSDKSVNNINAHFSNCTLIRIC